MTRQRKYDYEALRAEYIQAKTPISYTDLADKHGLSRSLLTDRGAREGWTAQRDAFREALGIKVTEAMTDQIAKFQIALHEKSIAVGLKYLDQYAAALDAGEIKMSTRDMVAVAAMVRVLTADAAASRQPGEDGVISEDAPMSPDAIRKAILQLEAGEVDGPGDAAEEPSPRTRQN